MAELKIVPKQSALNQYLAAIVVSVFTMAYGLSYGWASPSIMILTSEESPLPSGKITMEQSSWIAALPCAGGFFGNIIFGFITTYFGRKTPLILMAIPTVMSWLMILFAQNVYYLYAARILNGTIGGGMFVLAPMFVSEIASDRHRGFLGTLVILMTNFGLLLSFIMGSFCDYYFVSKFAIGSVILFAVLFSFFHESPTGLIKQNKIKEAEQSIRFYNFSNKGESEKDQFIQIEMDKLRNAIGSSEGNEEKTFSWSDIVTNPGRKAFMMGIGFAILYVFCGVIPMLNYTTIIFQETGSNFSPDLSAIFVGAVQFIGALVTTNLVDRAGRKLLYILSTLGTSFGLISLATYMLLKTYGYEVEDYNWIPITSFSIVLFLAAWAILTLPFVVINETMPETLKEFGTSFCAALIWGLEFVLIKCLPFMNEICGFYGTLFLFASICLSGTILIIFFMPETKGKSHEEIMKLLQ